MDRKNFLQHWCLKIGPPISKEIIQDGMKVYTMIEECLPAKTAKNKEVEGEYYETKKGRIIQGESLVWFESIWGAWNTGVVCGSKGGKKEGGDAFLDNIKNRNDAEMAYKAAMLHSKKERKELEAKGTTAPYFNLWMNAGRWQIQTSNVNAFGDAGVADQQKQKELQQEVRELRQEIAGTEKTLELLGADNKLRETTIERIENLKAKLMQAQKELNDLNKER